MSREILPPLFHAFESGLLDWPDPQARTLYLGAAAAIPLPSEFAQAGMVQGFRPDFLTLQRRGYHIAPVVEGDGYDMALVVAGKHRGENESRLAQAIRHIKPGGLVVIAGSKTDGISSLRKRAAEMIGVVDHLSKNHGEAFWLCATPLQTIGLQKRSPDYGLRLRLMVVFMPPRACSVMIALIPVQNFSQKICRLN